MRTVPNIAEETRKQHETKEINLVMSACYLLTWRENFLYIFYLTSMYTIYMYITSVHTNI